MRSSTHIVDCRFVGDALAQQQVVVDAIRRGDAARTMSSRSHRSVVGTFPSRKMHCAFRAESGLEWLAMLHCDVLESVVAFRPNAVEVRFEHDGRARTAYPDIAVLRRDGRPEFWEIKPASHPGAERLQRLRALARELSLVGIPYMVRQPHWLCREPALKNARAIHRHAGIAPPGCHLLNVARALSERGGTTLAGMAQALELRSADLLGFVARGMIALDIGAHPITGSTPIMLPLSNATSGAFDSTLSEDR